MLVKIHSNMAEGTALLGIFFIVLPQIEKRFSLSSTDIGLIAGANDVAAIFFGIFISYYGDFANKIRWISFGGIVTAIGLFLFTLPHYIAGRYVPPTSVELGIRMCILNSTQDDCPEGSAVDWYYMAIFCISQFIAGTGMLPLYSMAPAYFEENVSKKLVPIYIGLWNLAVICGPWLGFLLSDPLTSLYVDITQPESVNLTSKDPRWIGNWWIGFLVSAGVLTLTSVVLLGFPTHFKAEEEKKKSTSVGRERKTARICLKEFLASLKELMHNTVFVCNCLALTIPSFVMRGISPFFAKLLIMKYGISLVNVGKATAFSSAPGIVFGSLLGSVIVSRFDLKHSLKKSAFVCLIGQIFVLATPFAFLIPGCGNVNLAGLAVDYGERLLDGNNSEMIQFSKSNKFLQSSCNDECGCSLQGFLPLCGSDNISYLDPCHAGCTVYASLQPLEFTNCSCVSPSTFPHGGNARLKFCDQGCRNWEWFLLFMGFITVFFFLILIPSRIVVLRCVPEKKQAFAIGMQYISLKILAYLPGPLIMGVTIDNSCKVWQHVCGKTGSCSIYDIDKMTLTISMSLLAGMVLGIILFFISWWHCDNEDCSNDVNTCTDESPLNANVTNNETVL